MDHTMLVRCLEPFSNLSGDRQCYVEGHWTLRDSIREGRPFNQLEHQSAHTVLVFNTVNLRDIGMAQRCEDLRLALKPCDSLHVVREDFGQYLNGHVTLQAGVARAIHLTHAAGTNQRGDFIGSETGAGRKSHILP